jgi:hypothetical protein
MQAVFQTVFIAPGLLWHSCQSKRGELVLQGSDLGVQLGKLLEQVHETSGRSRQRRSTVSGLYRVCRQGLDLFCCASRRGVSLQRESLGKRR